jgi:ectoine hydroxylase-related dioxygenase (phytanoyl-CoA dioxygenase family)
MIDSAREVRRFRERGCLLVEGEFSGPELAALTGLVEELESAGQRIDLPNGAGRSTSFVKAVEHDKEVAPLVDHPAIRARAERLAAEPLTHIDTRIIRKASGAGSWGWHQEFRYWRTQGLTTPNLIAAMIYLEAATTENGCLELIPGSHRLGPLAHHPQGGQEVIAQAALEEIVGQHQVWSCAAGAGATIFFHGLTLHSSQANASSRSRLSVLLTFVPVGARDSLGPPSARPT